MGEGRVVSGGGGARTKNARNVDLALLLLPSRDARVEEVGRAAISSVVVWKCQKTVAACSAPSF